MSDFILKEFMPFKVTVLSNKISAVMAKIYSEKFNVSIPEWRVLALLSQHKSISAQMVVDETPLDKVAVSRAVAALEAKAFIEKAPSPKDGRVLLLSLTEEGNRVTQEIQQIALKYEQETLSVLSKNEQDQLQALLSKLIEKANDLA